MEERENRLIDVAELAKRLQLPESWVYTQVRRRKITNFPVEKYGKYLRFDFAAVREWARNNDS